MLIKMNAKEVEVSLDIEEGGVPYCGFDVIPISLKIENENEIVFVIDDKGNEIVKFKLDIRDLHSAIRSLEAYSERCQAEVLKGKLTKSEPLT